jgi:hypothetical protein
MYGGGEKCTKLSDEPEEMSTLVRSVRILLKLFYKKEGVGACSMQQAQLQDS